MPQRYIDRPPRIEPELPSGVNSIPNPPDVEDNPGDMLAQAFLPVVMVFGYIVVAMMGQSRNLLVMVPMILSIVASIGLVFYTRSRETKKRRELASMYLRRLSELRRKMESEHQQQRIYFYYNYPNPETTLGIANDLERLPNERQEEIRSGTRLWERRPTDHDFLHLRLGISTQPSTVIYKASDTEKTNSPLNQEAIRLANDSQLIRNVPVTVSVFQGYEDENNRAKTPEGKLPDDVGQNDRPQTQVRHSIGITGPSEPVYAYMRTLLVDYAAFHSPEDTMLYVAGTTAAEKMWVWAFALPHCQKADQTQSIKFEKPTKPAENEQDQMRLFWKDLRTILERRRMRLQDKETATDVKLPFILVVVDVLEPALEWSCLKDLEAEAAISTILLDGEALGAAIIFLCAERTKVPSRCSAVIEVDMDPLERNQAIFRYAETGFSTTRYLGTTTLVPSFDRAREFTNALAPLDVRRGYGSSLAATVTLMEMLNVKSIEQLHAMAKDNWRRSKTKENADWLRTAIGLLSGNEPRVLTFSANADGVHGIIAGSTGSGKSELLMTLIIGLALNYDPSILNFVLIDYKGGTAFEPFQNLPHKVDIVTNLDQSATARVFASINAELNRRQEINKNSTSKDIVQYRARGYHLEADRMPYPHLFIIIDEFAEMIAGNAEYKAQLESITRLGRALGVTLILAAQRPTGVTDQMRANIKFRICLRVETVDDSREVLRRNDAAFLPPGVPGRGYLQIGNENVELIQTAYTGGDYTGEEDKTAVPNVIWVDRPKRSNKQKNREPDKLYDVIVGMVSNLAAQESKPQWRPWPEFLPAQKHPHILSLESALDTAYMDDPDLDLLRIFGNKSATNVTTLNGQAGSFRQDKFEWAGVQWGVNAMRPLVGVIDNPYKAFQKPLMVNFPNGHAVVFGASGRGKTTFLRTVISSLALTHSPDELNVYILDFGGRALSIFKDLPHVVAMITSEEEERVLRLLRRVRELIDQRQIVFSEANANNLETYNKMFPAKALPAILVVIDNFADFREYYDGFMGPFISLVRDARSFGVHFLFSADVPNALTNKLFNLITERMTLKLSDAGEYGTVVGRGVPADLNNVPGRGYVRVENMPLEFQTALSFAPDADETDDLAKLKLMVEGMKQLWNGGWRGTKPASIEILQLRVSLDKLIQDNKAPTANGVHALMGIDDRNLSPLWLDLERQGPHMMIIGQPLSGKTTTLQTMLISMAYFYSPDTFAAVLVDLNGKLWRGSNRSLAELPHVIQKISDLDELDLFLANFTAECKEFDQNPRRRKMMILIDNYDTFSEEGYRKNMGFFEGIAGVVRKYQSSGVWVVIAGSQSITGVADDLRKIVAAPGFGIALKSADAVNRLNGKFPRNLAEQELPNGRAFSVRSGITNMMQIATPIVNEGQSGEELDRWVERIIERYPDVKANWTKPVKSVPSAPPSQPGSRIPAQEANDKTESANDREKVSFLTETENPYVVPPAPPVRPIEEYNLDEIKQLLIVNGMPDMTLKLLSPEEIVSMAYAFGLLEDKAS